MSAARPPIRHGGDLVAARAAFPQAPEPWLDLSTGINPIPWPLPDLPAEAWTRLPGRDETAALETAAATAYRLRPGAIAVAAPGTQALIQALPRHLPGDRVGILGFTYQEHEAVWRAAGRDVRRVDDPADLAGFDVALLVNPNNPDGRLIPPGDLVAIAAALARRGGTLVVDEAFMDVIRPRDSDAGGRAAAGDAGRRAAAGLASVLPGNAVILRSFGKVFGLAGLRLGFALADDPLAAALRADLGPWAVSGPALAIGTAALADAAWLDAAVLRLEADAARLDALLAAAGCIVLGGTPLFRLVRHPEAQDLADRLGRAGILVRRFDDPEKLRFGLPGPEADWRRLESAL